MSHICDSANRASTVLAVVLAALSAMSPVGQAAEGRQRSDLPANVRALVQRAEPTLDQPTRATTYGRRDARTGVDRAWYRVGASLPDTSDGAPVERRATRFLAANSARFGWSDANRDLALTSIRRGINTTHLTYEQSVARVPVYGRTVRVSLAATGKPTFVVSGYDADLPRRMQEAGLVGSALQPAVTSARATDIAHALFEGGSPTAEPRLVVLPDEEPRLAWVIGFTSDDYPGDWEVLVDAHDGSPIRVRDRAIRRNAHATSASNKTRAAFLSHEAEPLNMMFEGGHSLRVEGSGRVFEPDPLTTAGVMYGPPFVDDNDADIEALNAQLIQVPLHDITLDGDNLYRLVGPHVAIVGGGPLNYTPPAEPTPDGFSYGRGNDAFEAVNVYYHIDQSQRYVRSLGFTENSADGLTANPQGILNDNSLFLPTSNRINLGTGGVDDGEDAGVIWHEYGHALLEDVAPGLIDGSNGQALHEGWADYWATSFARGLTEAGKTARLDWQNVFRWDSGDGAIWPGRTIGVAGIYPDDTTCDDLGDSQHDGCDIYHDGLIWASTLMEIYDGLGKSVSDRLNLQSHLYLAPGATPRDAAEALLQADQDLYGGAHIGVLESRLAARGYIETASQAPYLEHEPLSATEAVGDEVSFVAVALSPTSEIDSVRVVYTIGGADEAVILLSAVDETHFSGAITLPSEPADVTYRIEAFDAEGRMSTLPTGTTQHYSFFVGPDTEVPVVVHEPVEAASTIAWPPFVGVMATDNLGVEGVRVSYELRAEGGGLLASGEFDLAPGVDEHVWLGAFPIDRSAVLDGSYIDYSIVVTDAALASNATREPEVGAHRIQISTSGTLLSLDFEREQPALRADGIWVRATPGFPLQVAHSGATVWSTGESGPYPDSPQLSTLELPAFDLSGITAYLTFWHWYDFEHEDNAVFWDGGNVKISVDGGAYEVATPIGGYTGTIVANEWNPLAGEPVFGGYSRGWRREIIALPDGADIRVRFDFGTDDSNGETSVGFGGWALDDLVITTELPVDVDAPVVEVQPEERIVLTAGDSSLPLTVRAVDDTGIESIELLVESGAEFLVSSGRFAMDLGDLDVFHVTLDFDGASAGDSLVYRLRARDFDGNEAIVPASGADPHVVAFRTIESVDVLAQAVGWGAWSQNGSMWRASAAAPAERRIYSGLILAPIHVPANVETSRLIVSHSYALAEGSGGNVKISEDDGATWTLLTPDEGYDGTWEGDWTARAGHPLDGEPIFHGAGIETMETFDVSAYRGRSIRVRFDAGFPGEGATGPAATSYWRIESVAMQSVSADEEIEAPVTFALDANFPDPFADATTITYTLPREEVVMLAVHDILGRRVRVLRYTMMPAGVHTETMTADGLASGIYFLVLTAGGRKATERIAVVR